MHLLEEQCDIVVYGAYYNLCTSVLYMLWVKSVCVSVGNSRGYSADALLTSMCRCVCVCWSCD